MRHNYYSSTPLRRIAWGIVCFAILGSLCARPLHAERLVLKDGQELTGESLEISEGRVLWRSAGGGLLTILLTDIERLELEPQPEPVVVPPSPALSDPDVVLGSEQSDPMPTYVPLVTELQQTYTTATETAAKWTQRIQIGGQFNDGNTQTDLIDVAAVFEQNTKEQMRQIDGGGQWGRSQSKQTANRWWVNSNFDWPLHDKWIAFTTSKNEYNEPANLDYRGTLSAGLGYRFFFEDKRRLIVRCGPAYTIEIFDNPYNLRQTPDAFAELEAKWPLFDRTALEQKTRVQPSLLDIELVRVNSTTAVIMDLDEKDRWKLRLGMQYQYNSQPNPGRVPSDYMTTVSLVYQRK
jgi:putative salt-induced outer membrane protein YdiY